MQCLKSIDYYKVTELPSKPKPNSIYFVLDGDEVHQYITDIHGVPMLVGGAEEVTSYTDEDAQNAVGSILSNEFSYDDSISISSVDWSKITNTPTFLQAGDNVSELVNDAGYIAAEGDPIFSASVASSITDTDISNWNTAFSWGDHADAGYITSSDNIYNTDGTLTNNRTVDLNGNALTIISNSNSFLGINTASNSYVYLQAHNPTGEGNISGLNAFASDETVQMELFSTFNNGEKFIQIEGYADATTAVLSYTSDTHTFIGDITLDNLAGNGNGVVAVDDDGKLSWSGGSSLFPVSGTSTATGDVTAELDGNALSIRQDDNELLLINTTLNSEGVYLRAYNPAGAGNFGGFGSDTSDTHVTTGLYSLFNNAIDGQTTYIEQYVDAESAIISYVADEHQYKGSVFLEDLAGNGVGIVSIDNDGNLGFTSGVSTDWGDIGGTLSDQTDLQEALDSKAWTLNVMSSSNSTTTDGATQYFGTTPAQWHTSALVYQIPIDIDCILIGATIRGYASTAGSNEAWPLYVRVNNTTDHLIATVSASTNVRLWSNTSLNVSLTAGDVLVIKSQNPNWTTNPATLTFSGYLRFI